MANLRRVLQEKQGFSEAESAIADYLVEHFRELGNFSTRQLAKATYTNSAAIVRFTQKLGFEGYVDFKVHFMAEMMQHEDEPPERHFTRKDNVPLIMEKMMYLGINTFKETHDILDPAIVVRAVHRIRQADQIDFYAMGNNRYPLHMMVESFAMVGKTTSLHDNMASQYLQAYSSPKNHIGFFVSRTGENRMLLDIAQKLKERKVPLLLITANPKSILGQMADVAIPATDAEHMNEGGPRIFIMSITYILHVLWAVLMGKEDAESLRHREEWLSKNFYY